VHALLDRGDNRPRRPGNRREKHLNLWSSLVGVSSWNNECRKQGEAHQQNEDVLETENLHSLGVVGFGKKAASKLTG
jgi:hypothetical protein